jgi:hypothetical protein
MQRLDLRRFYSGREFADLPRLGTPKTGARERSENKKGGA